MLVEIYFFQDLYAASLFWNGVLEKIAFLTLLLQFIICLHNDKSMLVALLSGFICVLFNLIFFFIIKWVLWIYLGYMDSS